MTIKIIKIGKLCHQSYPCMHFVITDNNGKTESKLMRWFEIFELAKETNFDLTKERCYTVYN